MRRLYDLVIMNTEYPQPVKEALNSWQEALVEPDLLLEQEIHPYFAKQAVRDVFGPALIDAWLKTGECQIDEDLAETLVNRFIIQATLLEMKDSGLLDSIENEHGEEVFWATQKGKEKYKKI